MANKLLILQSDCAHYVDADDIVYCEAQGGYTNIMITDNNNLTYTKTLSKLCQEIGNREQFIRISQSHFVNKQYIKKINKKSKTIELLATERIIPFTIKYKELLNLLKIQDETV